MRRPSAIAIGLVVLLLAAMAVVGFVWMPGGDPGDDGIPLHADPGEYTGDGDLDAVQSWLGGWLDSRLSDSLVEVSEGQAETAKELLGDDYAQRLGQFADVADDDEESQDYEEAGDDHERLAELMTEYNETWEAYEDALERGDGEAAHTLAREINELATEIEAISDRIVERVDRVPLRPDALEAVNETREAVSNESQQVREEHFTETVLSVTAIHESASFTAPATLEGTLVTTGGEPIANESIEIIVSDQPYFVDTDENGGFSLEFRPVDLPTGQNEIEAMYVPDPASEYLGSSTSVTLEVEQVTPTMTVTVEAESAGFGDTVSVAGTLAVQDVPVDGVTLEVVLDGMVVGEVGVEDGDFAGEFDVPATIEPGEVPLEVRLPFEDRALAGVNASVDLTITETETDISLDGEFDADTETLEITGELHTEAGEPVSDQPIQLSFDGAQPRTVQTTNDGTFSETVDVSDTADNVTIGATFDGSGTNLVGSEAEMTVAVDGTPGTSTPWLTAAVVAVLLLIGTGGWWYRRRAREDETPETTAEQATRTPSMATPQVEDRQAILDAAIDHFTEERFNEAVVLGYGAMRAQLGEHIAEDRAFTHWEFLDEIRTAAQQNGLPEETVDQLAAATSAFERASFDRRGVTFDEATAVIDASKDVVTHDEGQGFGFVGGD